VLARRSARVRNDLRAALRRALRLCATARRRRPRGGNRDRDLRPRLRPAEDVDVDRPDARPWLLGIAANLLRRHWRTERRRLEAYARAGDHVGSISDAAARVEIVAALDSLSRNERETLFLYAVADLSYDEIADALEIPVGTVRSRLARARGRVRQHLRNGSVVVESSRDPKESFNV
jgi:RNA polymerase sigma factor (sigma-70 family)